jgi:predicted nucleotidyltransferase
MNRQEILNRLRENERALRERGVMHAALFGSCARGDDRPDSDIDILLEIEPRAGIDLFEYVGIKHYLEDLFAARVDIANLAYLKPLVRPRAEREAIYAF